jgi:hypothetical protein
VKNVLPQLLAIVAALRNWKATDWSLVAGLFVSLLLMRGLVTVGDVGPLTGALQTILSGIAGIVPALLLVVKILEHRGIPAAPTQPPPGSPVLTTPLRIHDPGA